MKARARNIGADLVIDSIPGVGTSVCMTVPLTGRVVEAVPVEIIVLLSQKLLGICSNSHQGARWEMALTP
jgi:hypothetical protein